MSIDRARALTRMKAIALGFLLGAIALLVLAQHFGRHGAWGWIGAFAEAATVGALADWFAVVALFRHPLGLPIPHTAIIPRNKKRIADALARFVADNFLAPEQILKRVDEWNPALRLGEFLSTPERLEQLSRQLQAWARQSLDALDSPVFERELMAMASRQLQQWDTARTASQLMHVLTRGGHHQKVLNAGLSQIAAWMGQPGVRDFITEKLIVMARQEFPKLTWLADKLDYTEDLAVSLSTRLANAIIDEVQDVLNTPDHPLRQRYGTEAMRLVDALEDDPELQQRIAAFKQKLIDSPELQDYVRGLWRQVRAWLRADLARDDSTSMQQFRHYAERLGRRLHDDPVWQTTANEQLRIAGEHIAAQLRVIAPAYIRQTVDAWDTRFLVDEIERSVGRDLQYIRLNGTVIGGLAGLLLHALFQLPLLH